MEQRSSWKMYKDKKIPKGTMLIGYEGREFIDLSSVPHRNNRYKEYDRLNSIEEIEKALNKFADETNDSMDEDQSTGCKASDLLPYIYQPYTPVIKSKTLDSLLKTKVQLGISSRGVRPREEAKKEEPNLDNLIFRVEL